MKCSTCGKQIETEDNWVEFKCPACGEDTIFRCEHCKKLENQYTCQKCGFKGP